MNPVLTVYLKTYRRPVVLRNAIESILMQDFDDYELVIHDDASGDETSDVVASYPDRRIRYIQAEQNIGGIYGDTEIVNRLQATCTTWLCVHVNDDDYYYKPDLFSTQVNLFREIEGLAMCLGGVAQKYNHYVPLYGGAVGTRSRYIGDDEDTVFIENVWPHGTMSGRQFLELYADEYPARNIVHGAAMFRSEFLTPDSFNREFAWQAGAALNCGMATKGGIYYIDEPCLINRVEIDCASFRGTQKMHFEQCLASISAGYAKVMHDPEMKRLRDRTALGVTQAYLGNKIANRQGYFRSYPVGDISHIMTPEITSVEFLAALAKHDISITEDQRKIIELSDIATGWDGMMNSVSKFYLLTSGERDR